MSDGYFSFSQRWYCRWSEYREGKRVQPSHRLASVRDYPKKAEVKALAAEYMGGVRKTQTVEAESTVEEFVASVFFPRRENYPGEKYHRHVPAAMESAQTASRIPTVTRYAHGGCANGARQHPS